MVARPQLGLLSPCQQLMPGTEIGRQELTKQEPPMAKLNFERRIERLTRQLSAHLSKPRPGNLSRFDEDALTIYCSTVYMDARMAPRSNDIAPTKIYARGRELRDAIYGPIIPAYQDAHLKRYTRASGEFELAIGREPKVGDILRLQHLYRMHSTEIYARLFGELSEAWQRRLPQFPCPLKFEDGRLFRRLLSNKRGAEPTWEDDVSIDAEIRWLKIPQVYAETNFETMETITGLTFLGVQNGTHRCRAATNEEFMRQEIERPVEDAAFFRYAEQRFFALVG
jgi:hypothetical protein